jgi:hypothetical protein
MGLACLVSDVYTEHKMLQNKHLLVAALLAAAMACRTAPKPPPTPPQPPPFVPPVSEQCHLIGATCGCWHQPPGEEWQRIECPEPPAAEQCLAPTADDPGWGSPIPPSERAFTPAIRAAILDCMNEVGDPCGTPFMEGIAKLGACLRGRGYQAGPSADALAVLVPGSMSSEHQGGIWEEWHATHSRTGCWANGPGAYKNVWPLNGPAPPCGGSTPTEPPPAPPEEPEEPEDPSACGSPTPPPLSKFRCGPHNAGYDCTPLVYSQGGAFCKEIGMLNPDNVTGRLFCPPRPEGHPEREACEAQIVGGEPVWHFPDGWDCHSGWLGNPYLAICSGTTRPPWFEACNADETICNRFNQ